MIDRRRYLGMTLGAGAALGLSPRLAIGAADPAAAKAQIEESFRRFGVATMDLIQVHNLGDIPVQLGILKEL